MSIMKGGGKAKNISNFREEKEILDRMYLKEKRSIEKDYIE